MRICVALVLFAAAFLLPLTGWVRFAAFLAVYAVIGWDVLWRAVRNIARGQVFDENFLMALATVGAFFVGEYPEGVAVMLFYQVGEWFQSYAVGRSRRSITALMDIRPDYANVYRADALVQVDPNEVAVGEEIVVKPGERIPLDGQVVDGTSMVDTSALTGESVPRDVSPGSSVISGCVNLNGVLTIKVEKEFGASTVSKILDLVENASSKKAKAENFITKFARYYTPVVVISAALLAIAPPLVLGGGFERWIYQALIFLVISCPCALVISVPLSFFGGIGGASKLGILIKGSNYMEVLSKVDTVVFDKTGTLTKGTFAVTGIIPAEGVDRAQLLELAAYVEGFSSHPIALSLRQAYGREIDQSRVADVQEIAGHGVRAVMDGQMVCAGNGKMMELLGLQAAEVKEIGTIVHVSADMCYLGYIVIADELKPDAATAVAALKKCGIHKTVMLTGDTAAAAEAVAAELGLDEVHAGLLPADKVAQVEALLSEPAQRGALAFVGDGINDAPVLSRADIGIAMGGLGSDAAIEAADVVLMDDKPSRIASAVRLARRTLMIVRQNIVFALGIKALVLVLGALGMANMWEAVFADVGVSFLAILNATRALRVNRLK